MFDSSTFICMIHHPHKTETAKSPLTLLRLEFWTQPTIVGSDTFLLLLSFTPDQTGWILPNKKKVENLKRKLVLPQLCNLEVHFQITPLFHLLVHEVIWGFQKQLLRNFAVYDGTRKLKDFKYTDINIYLALIYSTISRNILLKITFGHKKLRAMTLNIQSLSVSYQTGDLEK